MSTTTSIKRIALVAVAALGFGMLSVAPSSATVIANSLTIDAATDSITLGESATAVLTHSFVATNANDSVTITAIKTSSNAGNAGSIRLNLTESSTSASTTAGVAATSPGYVHSQFAANSALSLLTDPSQAGRPDSVTVQSNATANRSNFSKFGVTLYNPQAAGTYEIKFYMTYSNGGVTAVADTTVVTWTVTVAAADTVPTGASTATLRAGEATITGAAGGTREGTDSTVVASRTALATDTIAEATIYVIQKTAALTAGNESMTVTVSGEAFVNTNEAVRATSGKAITVAHDPALATAGTGTPIYVWATGTAGKATITVSTVSGLLLGTKTVTFFGSAASIEIDTTYGTHGRAGGYSYADAFDIAVKDSGGNAVVGASVTVVSGNPAAVASGSCVDLDNGVSDGIYTCEFTSSVGSKSGDKATLTFRVPVPLSSPVTYYTVTADVTLGGSVATETVTFDKTSYSPGEGMVVTRTAKDASGNPVYDGAPAVALTGNKNISNIPAATYTQGSVTTESKYLGTVTRKFTVFAPSSTGEFTYSGLGGALGLVEISASATVSDDSATAAATAASDAAAEATDAANAATDAANAAAEAADAATAAAQDAADAVAALSTSVTEMVNALKKQITSLTNLVIKIQKKVRA
jgi:trimeric autotransporter adhesin